jgi:hypothetical protein
MVIDEVYCVPFATFKTFLYHHLFNKDGKGFMELLKCEN